jgi:hypothetical protein
MRKTLAVLVLVAALSSCGTGNTEAPATACDTCVVAGDTTTPNVIVDSAAAQSAEVK